MDFDVIKSTVISCFNKASYFNVVSWLLTWCWYIITNKTNLIMTTEMSVVFVYYAHKDVICVTILEDQHNTNSHFITPFITVRPVEVILNRPRERGAPSTSRANVYNKNYIKIIVNTLSELYCSGSLSGYSRNLFTLPGFPRDYLNSRDGLLPRLSELPSRAFPETLQTPELMT